MTITPLSMTKRGRVYERFHQLDPLPGSVRGGTEKPVEWQVSRAIFREKWPEDGDFGVNLAAQPRFVTNRVELPSEKGRSGMIRAGRLRPVRGER